MAAPARTSRNAPGDARPPGPRHDYLRGMAVHVTSEIGTLREVLVHTPGRELLAVTPSTREDYLYDDIIDAEAAQREYRRFVALL